MIGWNCFGLRDALPQIEQTGLYAPSSYPLPKVRRDSVFAHYSYCTVREAPPAGYIFTIPYYSTILVLAADAKLLIRVAAAELWNVNGISEYCTSVQYLHTVPYSPGPGSTKLYVIILYLRTRTLPMWLLSPFWRNRAISCHSVAAIVVLSPPLARYCSRLSPLCSALFVQPKAASSDRFPPGCIRRYQETPSFPGSATFALFLERIEILGICCFLNAFMRCVGNLAWPLYEYI